MCTSVARSYIRLFNYLLGLLAFGLVVLASYLTAKDASIFTYLLLSIGLYILIVSFIGHYTATGRGGCGVVYIFLFTLLLLFEGVIVCAFVFASEKTINFLEDMDQSHKEAVESAKKWVEEHTAVIKTVGIIWFSIQILTLLVTACSYQRLAHDYRRATEGDGPLLTQIASDDDSADLRRSSSKRSVTSTPNADAARQAMHERWGHYGIRGVGQKDNDNSGSGGSDRSFRSGRQLSSSRSVELGTSK